ncbi:MAG: helix-turn-helix transcriptional regulator [Phycisphaerales bacterium]|nr:PAS domain-containing protein [Planctomycetota bacterium]MCH8509311.1 helix-turn-helix transcriptional regulator [Phycisphaerales bacterium]
MSTAGRAAVLVQDAAGDAEGGRLSAPAAGFGPANRITRDALWLLETLCGVACVIRDERLRVLWCNDAYARLCDRPVSDLIGTTMDDFLPKAAAEERGLVLSRVLRSGEPEAYYQFGADKRMLCRVLPCDPEAFGCPAVLAMVQEAPVGSALRSSEPLPVLTTPCLDQLGALSPSELRALYYIAKGLSTADIAERLCRATKTVEKHIESLHRKLRTSSRAEIVRLATERGLQAFEESQWEAIIEGAKAVKRRRG